VDDHVMPIHGVAEWNGMPYIVSPYCRGVTLEKRIRDQGPLAVEEVLRIGMQTALGLAAAHEQGLVHRDVKPANILLDEGVERVQLTDFGLARTTDDIGMTRTGILAGTPQFMSPEQTRGEALDARSDLFALGSVLYTMCVGQPPFRGANPLAVMQKIANDRAPVVQSLNPSIPPALSRLIERLMEKRPSHRIPSAMEAAEQLRELLASRQRGDLPAGRTGFVLRAWHVASLSAVCFIAAIGFYVPGKLASTATTPPNDSVANSPKPNEVASGSAAGANAHWAAGWGVDRRALDEVWGRVRALESHNDPDKSNNDDMFRQAIEQLRRDIEQVDRRFDQWSQ
jgi:serine/threonine protein kinase